MTNRLLGALFKVECVCLASEGKGLRIPGALLKEGFVHTPNQVEFGVTESFPMFACFSMLQKWDSDRCLTGGKFSFSMLRSALVSELLGSGFKEKVLLYEWMAAFISTLRERCPPDGAAFCPTLL